MTHKDPHIEQEVQQVAPDLEPLLSAWQPTLPDGYFDALQTQILAKTVDAQHDAGKRSNKRILLWSTLSAAALVLIFIGIQFWPKSVGVTPGFEEQLALLSSDDILEIIHQEAELPEVESILESGLITEQEVFTEMGVYQEVIMEKPESAGESDDAYILTDEEIQSLDDEQWLELMETEIGL